MNRIELPTQSISTSTSFTGSDHSRDVTALGTRRQVREGLSPHTTFVPMHYEPGYAYPLVVWLHGAPGNEHELRQVMPLVSMRNFVGAAPRGTFAERRMPNAYGWRQSPADIEEAESRIDDCIRLTRERYNIHPDRIFLVGHGGGGTMALRVAWNNPEKFAGVATFGGPIPWHLRPFRCVNQIRSLPCLLSMSRGSHDYPDEQVCNDLRLLHSAGCTVALRQYPSGDGLTTVMLADLNRWLMEFVCSGNDS